MIAAGPGEASVVRFVNNTLSETESLKIKSQWRGIVATIDEFEHQIFHNSVYLLTH